MFRFYENSAVKADALLNALGIKEQVGELPEVSPRDRYLKLQLTLSGWRRK
jgi:hypothetical protein